MNLTTKSQLILVVDDDEDHLKSTQELVKAMGYEVISAIDGMDAFEKYQQHLPALVIMDIKMPKMDGYEGLFKIKEKFPDSKVILMTAYDDYSQFGKAKKHNLVYFLKKPFSPNLLLDLIKQSLQQN